MSITLSHTQLPDGLFSGFVRTEDSIPIAAFDFHRTTFYCELEQFDFTDEVMWAFIKGANATGLDLDDEKARPYMGWSKRAVLQYHWEKILGENHPELAQRVENSFVMFCSFLESFYAENSRIIKPTPGCIDLLHLLKSREIPVILTTGFYRRVCDQLLGYLGWLDHLDRSYVGNSNSLISVSVTPTESRVGRQNGSHLLSTGLSTLSIPFNKLGPIFYIGDTKVDITFARDLGATVYGAVTSGSFSLRDFAIEVEKGEPGFTSTDLQRALLIPSLEELSEARLWPAISQ